MKHITKPVFSVSTRLLLAALFWNTAAAILAIRGLGALLNSASSPTTLLLVLPALVMGLLKSRFILDRTAQKAAMRIRAVQNGYAFGFFSLKSWIMILFMMGLGMLLRLLHMPLKAIGVIYLTITAALLISSRILWREYKGKPAKLP